MVFVGSMGSTGGHGSIAYFEGDSNLILKCMVSFWGDFLKNSVLLRVGVVW